MAFSTNANQSTKDNISNVYGAKTIPALIPLNLDFEMEPSNRPGATQSARNWSTQEDSGSHTVKIVGHISRPVVGEGRQTPDRQMFFVNSRPCNLPQVAKAFNEVYKSFNITQSPFIFADIKLDTNAYDVNVSPDKRTIMLHDQTTLLESLKEALSAMFESHDQSVPQAQLPGKRTIPSIYKTPSLVPNDSTGSESANEAHQSLPINERLSSAQTEASTAHTGFVKASLIERFAGRDAEDRHTSPATRQRRVRSSETENNLRAQATSAHHTTSPEEDVSLEQSRDEPQSPLFEPDHIEEDIPIRLSPLPKAVQDFNARMASQDMRKPLRKQPSKSSVAEGEENEVEPNIPAINQSTPKPSSQSTIQNAFDRMRPMRTPLHQATITIGDTTTVSTIGNGSESIASRKSRIHTPKFSLSGKPINQTPKASVFEKRLSKFAAPGTQLDSSEGEDGEGEGDEADEGDESDKSVHQHTLSSSPPQRSPVDAPEELQTSDAAEPGDTSPMPRARIEEESGDDEVLPEADAQTENAEVDSDEEYIDESEKKAKEEAKIAQMIIDAEEAAARPNELNLKRAGKLFKVTQKKYWTINLERNIETNIESITKQIKTIKSYTQAQNQSTEGAVLRPDSTQLSKEDPEERLSLTVTKSDFKQMQIIGQFNLGFIIAVRPPTSTSPTSDLFIIDQHASDEKYNFERLSATTTLVSQRLVHPHPLELTAVEEELILENAHALLANGFVVDLDTSGNHVVGSRGKLISLPMSREVTFTPKDLEELLALIMDNPPSSSTTPTSYIPRPSKVRKLLASRACRSSTMIGKTLQTSRMREIVRHMGSMDKPWSCPHGRPTMRHLYGLERWEGWSEGDGVVGVGVVGKRETDWKGFLRGRRK